MHFRTCLASIPSVGSPSSAPECPSALSSHFALANCLDQLLITASAHSEHVTLGCQLLCLPRRSRLHDSADFCQHCKHHSIWLELCSDNSMRTTGSCSFAGELFALFSLWQAKKLQAKKLQADKIHTIR